MSIDFISQSVFNTFLSDFYSNYLHFYNFGLPIMMQMFSFYLVYLFSVKQGIKKITLILIVSMLKKKYSSFKIESYH